MPTIPTTELEPTLADLMARASAALAAIVDCDENDDAGLVGHPDWEDRAALADDLETIAGILRSTR